jgi:hypothetical protein
VEEHLHDYDSGVFERVPLAGPCVGVRVIPSVLIGLSRRRMRADWAKLIIVTSSKFELHEQQGWWLLAPA